MTEQTDILFTQRITGQLKMIAGLPFHQVNNVMLYAKNRNTLGAHLLVMPVSAFILACWVWAMVFWGIGKLIGVPIF